MTIVSMAGFALIIVGMALFGWASAFRRAPGKPGLGSEGGAMPWRHRDWFTPAGNRARMIGWILWTAGTIVAVLGLLFRDRT
jgi:hypothetical protein